MAKNKKQQAAIAVSMKEKGKVPKGYHRMPDGKIMEGFDKAKELYNTKK